ncbi:hypothetical protein OOJ91_12485 [Micromonospora lupini]|uniref:hypothetical protein n=1 Tax=Micromonospora lupini TaxID=285679 RepID=UPI0022523D9B|nr:hypothetical protein [Micromonospora lupini]MCX5066697.1 hypothetical protein [Micromonospora lupini]
MTDPSTTTKPKRSRTVREMPAAALVAGYQLASYWFGITWCPAVGKTRDGGYQLRVLRSEVTRGTETSTRYDYFRTDPDGLVIESPRGLGRETNRKVRLTGLDELVAEHATAPREAAGL